MKKNSNTPLSNHSFTEANKLLEGKSDVLDNIMTSMGDGISCCFAN